MFEYIYSQASVSSRLISKSLKQLDGNLGLVPLVWTEHCMECAAPRCYSTCMKFQPRVDGHCVRIDGGITPIKMEKKGYVTQIHFREWAKIEAQMLARPLPCKQAVSLTRKMMYGDKVAQNAIRIIPFAKIRKFILEGWYSYRQRLINRKVKNVESSLSLVLIAKVENNNDASTILVDIKNDTKLLFRESLEIPEGCSVINIPIPPFDSQEGDLYFINIHPRDAEKPLNIIFDYLEIAERDIHEGKKVKCVIWDLDNTLWDGVLIENHEVKIKDEFISLIKDLDNKGIVNSIVSKNNEEDVEEKLKQLGISNLFVFKKVNWNPKSVNVSQTIAQMNINPNTVVFVDDNAFERMEVAQKQPSITCIHPEEFLSFVKCDRFDVPITEDAQKRRSTYQMMEKLKEEEEQWGGDIDDFLKSCKITATLHHPKEQEIKRCYELLQRTNQLNASGRRLSLEEVSSLVHDTTHNDCFVISSDDKFGSYGIVGFIAVNKSKEIPIITDFVISCRVANKKIEPTIVNHLAKIKGKILFNYKKTKLNGPMLQITKELGMQVYSSNTDYDIYIHQYSPNYGGVVTINENNL